MTDLEPYREALKQSVCSYCVDRNDDGSCGLEGGRACAIDLHFPHIVKAVEAVQSDNLNDYARSIAETVCAQCPNEDEGGQCNFRDNFDCALDTLTYLVVEAIEEVDQGKALLNREAGGEERSV